MTEQSSVDQDLVDMRRSLRQTIKEKMERSVIITFDISVDEKPLYKEIHDPLNTEHNFNQITETTYLFQTRFSKKEIEILKKSIVDLYNVLVKDEKGDTSKIKLIVANESELEIIQVIPAL